MWKNILVCLFIASVFKGSQTTSSALNCKRKEKALANLDIAKDAISKAKLLLPSCAQNCSSDINSTSCEEKEKSAAYIDIALNLISVAVENYPDCDDSAVGDRNITEILKHKHPADCAEVLENGRNVSGIYTIWPRIANKSLEVYCDMETTGEAWTVIQRRGNFSTQEDFYRDWETYKNGFGNITKDFWIGNDNIFFLSNQKNYTLRFDLESIDRETRYAEYSYFRIEDEKVSYKLHYENYTGNAGDALEQNSKNRMFSTKDQQNDKPGPNSCAKIYSGAWWYWNCFGCNLNGLYRPNEEGNLETVVWLPWSNKCLLAVEIKLKPMSSF